MAASAVAAPSNSLRVKPRLSFWQIWNMSFGFLGIQFGFALQNGNMITSATAHSSGSTCSRIMNCGKRRIVIERKC